MSDLIGKTIGQYRIVEQIGLGGMATIFKAYQPSIDRYVAVKILPRHLARDPNFVKRFEQEAKSIAALEHPHILPVHDFGTDQGYNYMVMRYVEGGTLTDLMGRNLSYERVAEIVGNIAKALDYAHRQGVVHRDIKPSNVLIDKHGAELLTDFGIAKVLEDSESTKLTSAGSILGTPAYMAPEQAEGKSVDGRTDLYSLGVVLYELLTGQPPYQAETPLAIVLKHLHDPLPPPRTIKPGIPEAMERIVLKAMAKNPAERYQTAAEMAQALKQALAEMGKSAPTGVISSPHTDRIPVSAPPPAKSGSKVMTPLLIGGGLLVLLLCVGGGGLLLLGMSASSQSGTATPTTSGAAQAVLPTATGTARPAAATPAPATPSPTAPAPQKDTVVTLLPTLDGPVIFEDNFSANRFGWFTGDNDDDYGTYRAEIVDGRYHMSQAAKKGVFTWEQPADVDVADFVMTVEASPLEHSAAFAYGVIIRSSDNENFYAFEVDTDGYFLVNLFKGGEWTTLVEFTKLAAINVGESNRLTVQAKGPALSFFVNDEEAITLEDTTLDHGSIGVALELYDQGDTATVAFDNLVVRDLGETGAGPALGAATMDATTVLFADTFDSDVSGWSTGRFEDDYTINNVTIAEGRYSLTATTKKGAFVEKKLPNQQFSDFVMTVEATPLDTEEHYSYGMSFRLGKGGTGYSFEIGNDGLYSVLLYENEWKRLKDWSSSDAINAGETNKIMVVADGVDLSFYVNGELLTTLQNDVVLEGQIGLVVDMFEEDRTATVEYDNLEVRALK